MHLGHSIFTCSFSPGISKIKLNPLQIYITNEMPFSWVKQNIYIFLPNRNVEFTYSSFITVPITPLHSAQSAIASYPRTDTALSVGRTESLQPVHFGGKKRHRDIQSQALNFFFHWWKQQLSLFFSISPATGKEHVKLLHRMSNTWTKTTVKKYLWGISPLLPSTEPSYTDTALSCLGTCRFAMGTPIPINYSQHTYFRA